MRKYNIIYADPPWKYGNGHGKGVPEKHYKTMYTPDICKLPIKELGADDSILFIWGTWHHLPDILQVIKAWGYTYKTVAFVWVKEGKKTHLWSVGLGSWTRANTEYCLLATRGHPKRNAGNVRQLVIDHLREHSRKPDCVRDRIVQLMGDVPRIELFARQKTPGWDIWGNEVENDIEITHSEYEKYKKQQNEEKGWIALF